MGKGTIISHLGNGEYSITINYNRATYDAKIAALNDKISSLTSALYLLAVGTDEYNITKLKLASFKKQKSALEEQFPDDYVIDAWCADLTEDLAGVISTIEVPGEAQVIQIAPGFETKAAYNANTDGCLTPLMANMSPAWLYNIAMLPGWQKWKPTFRYGTISNIDTVNNKCTVTLETAKSSQQNLNINKETVLSNVPIEYMSCHAAAFDVDDHVLVKFEGQDWGSPKVIGFRENPKPCKAGYLYVSLTVGSVSYAIVWDFDIDDYAEQIPLNSGGFASFPCVTGDISTWINSKSRLYQVAIAKNTNIFYANSNAIPAFDTVLFKYMEPEQDDGLCSPSSSYPKLCSCTTSHQLEPLQSETMIVSGKTVNVEDGAYEATSYTSYYYPYSWMRILKSQWGLKQDKNISTSYEQVINAINGSGASITVTSTSEYTYKYESCHYHPDYPACGDFVNGRTMTDLDITSEVDGFFTELPSLTYQQDDYGRYSPAIFEGVCDILSEYNVNAWDIRIAESIYGDEDLPYIVTFVYKEVKKQTTYVNKATWWILGSFCEKDDSTCLQWPNSTCPAIADPEYEEIVEPKFEIFINEVDGNPANASPFDSALSESLTNAINEALNILIADFDDGHFDEILVSPVLTTHFLT